jgi:hypothetical protein
VLYRVRARLCGTCGHSEFLGNPPTPTSKRWEAAELIERRGVSVGQGQGIARRLMKKKRRSIRAARGRSRSGHAWRHWLLGPSDPAREEKRVHANGTRASFFLPLFSETLAQAGLLAKACKTTQGQQQQGGNEREMAGTPRSRQVPSCPRPGTDSVRVFSLTASA